MFTALLIFAAAGILLNGCNDDPWDVDVSDIEVDVKIHRVEKKFFEVPRQMFEGRIAQMTVEDSALIKTLLQQVYAIGPFRKPETILILADSFIFHPAMQDSIYPAIKKTFTQEVIDSLAAEFEEAYRHIRYYYPKDTLYNIHTIIGFFQLKSFTIGHDLFIALDLYMGDQFSYERMGFYEYMTSRFARPYILSDGLRVIFSDKYNEREYASNTLLDRMIYAGKQNLWIEAMAPDLEDSLIIGYTDAQMEWADDYEGEIWESFTSDETLFTTDEQMISRLIGEAPRTNALNFPYEAPPRLAEWVGWQIMRSYMKNNPDVTLQELMLKKNAQEILRNARYKPKA